MGQNTQQLQDDLLKEVTQLLADTKTATDDFVAKTGALVQDINKGLDEAGEELKKTDAELTEFEKEAVDKMDTAVLEFIAEDEEEEEERL